MPPRKVCARPGCTAIASILRCPKCKKLGIEDGSYYCAQACFIADWAHHKGTHKMAMATSVIHDASLDDETRLEQDLLARATATWAAVLDDYIQIEGFGAGHFLEYYNLSLSLAEWTAIQSTVGTLPRLELCISEFRKLISNHQGTEVLGKLISDVMETKDGEDVEYVWLLDEEARLELEARLEREAHLELQARLELEAPTRRLQGLGTKARLAELWQMAGPKHRSSQRSEKQNDCDTQLRNHDCDTLNAKIANIFRPQTHIPRPSLDPAAVPTTWDPKCIFDICETASMAWEITSSGMNGLRYQSFTQNSSGVRVLSAEVCKPTEEDLSSIIKYTASDNPGESLRKAYWLAQTFASCQTIASGLLTMCVELSRSFEFTCAPDGTQLNLKSARIQFYEICTMFDVRNEISGVPLCTRSHNKAFEPIHHAVVLLKDDAGIDHVVDLAGSQFGVFGPDSQRPQIVVEEVGKWKDNFVMCIDVRETLSSENMSKISLLNQVIKCMLQI